MKKLNTNNAGRMPLWQADLDWIQAGFTEPITAIVGELGLSKEYFIITGCSVYKPDKSHMAMDAGWFWWNGQILPVRALASTDIGGFTNPVVRLTKVTYTDTAGARNFILSDLSTETVSNVWQDDYLTPTVVERSAAFTAGVRLGIGAWALRDILAHHTAEDESDWIMTSNGDLEYKRIGRFVVLRGVADADNSYTPVTTGLPAPLGGTVYIAVPAGSGLYCKITNDGGMVLRGTHGEEPSFDGIMYMAATPYQATDPNTINDNPQS